MIISRKIQEKKRQMMNKEVQEVLDKLPGSPGVYIMRNKSGTVIYVGKAISLKNRVRQYFQPSNWKIPKVASLAEQIANLDYVLTDSEIEALVLEANLIKKYQPKFNVLLRDDKQYPYIQVTTHEMYPRVVKVRDREKMKGKVFGPFVSGHAVNLVMAHLRRQVPLRTCSLSLDGTRKLKRPCLNYDLGRCLGPCQGGISTEIYDDHVQRTIKVLSGKDKDLQINLKGKMVAEASQMNYEAAAEIRDLLEAFKQITEKQKMVEMNREDRDVVGIAQNQTHTVAYVFFLRNGKIQGHDHFLLDGGQDQPVGEILSAFIRQFYSGTAYIPREIHMELPADDFEQIETWLSQIRQGPVHLMVPQRGEKRKMVRLAKKNAENLVNRRAKEVLHRRDHGKVLMANLQEVLRMDTQPKRLEAYDISNLQHAEIVGAMVVFEDGVKKNQDYRRFKIRSIQGPDDYESFREMMRRRILRGLKEQNENGNSQKGFARFPDLILVDGGKGQISAVQTVLDECGLVLPICGMVKDDHHRTRALIFEGREIDLKAHRHLFQLITQIQDEVHRFAITYHRKLRKNTMVRSELDQIEGIGEKRRNALYRVFGSIDAMAEADVEALAEVPEMNRRSAESVAAYFKQKTSSKEAKYPIQ
jgi:excinuclease ABC subunit C